MRYKGIHTHNELALIVAAVRGQDGPGRRHVDDRAGRHDMVVGCPYAERDTRVVVERIVVFQLQSDIGRAPGLDLISLISYLAQVSTHAYA